MQVPDRSPPVPVRGAGHLDPAGLRAALRSGDRCVRFEFCVSLVFVTFRYQSADYLTATWQERYLRGLPFSLLSVLLGPWGVPWGPVLTLRAVWVNLRGGVDTSGQVLAHLEESPPEPA